MVRIARLVCRARNRLRREHRARPHFGTVRLNVLCRNGAERRGIADRFVPVIQGWHPTQYLRCIERMPFVFAHPLIGVGSMCRRHVEGEHGILRVVEELDRAFAGTATRLHLFGLKSQGMAAIHGHPLIASCDSQAYGMAARQDAYRTGRSKTDAQLAKTMASWYTQQRNRLDQPDYAFRPPLATPAVATSAPPNIVDARISEAAEELRVLHESGEIDWTDLSARAAYEMAFMDDRDNA